MAMTDTEKMNAYSDALHQVANECQAWRNQETKRREIREFFDSLWEPQHCCDFCSGQEKEYGR